MKKSILIVLLAVSLSSCSYFGSRETFVMNHNESNGQVYLGYHLEPGESDDIRWSAAKDKVKKHCAQVLSYTDAERFGKPIKTCIEKTNTGECLKFEVEVPYQCLGRGVDVSSEAYYK